MKRVRWVCPNDKHPSVLGPSRPRKDDIVRYCLACSEFSGKLALRTAPTLEARRAARKESLQAKAARQKERTQLQEAAYYEVHGLDVRAEIARLWRLPVALEWRRKVHLPDAPPEVIVRNRRAGARRYGVAYMRRYKILINRIEGHDIHTVRETVAHELAHILTPHHGHDHVWKNVYRLLCEEAYGFRPRVENRFIGECARMMRAAENAKAAGMAGPTIADLLNETLMGRDPG